MLCDADLHEAPPGLTWDEGCISQIGHQDARTCWHRHGTYEDGKGQAQGWTGPGRLVSADTAMHTMANKVSATWDLRRWQRSGTRMDRTRMPCQR